MNSLQSKVAIITGASRGLGRAIALAYAREGASLALCARGAPELEAVASAARELGADVLTLAADMHETAERERLVLLTLERWGRVDILVNNASELGPLPMPYLVDYPPHGFEQVMGLNLLAPYHLTWSVLGAMIQRGEGVVINITSDVAVHGYPGWGAYAVSKAALEGLTRTWVAELEDTGVRMYVVDPGDMDTAMHRAALPDDDPAQLARPEDVAESFVLLAGPDAPAPAEARLEAAALIPVRA
jgi:NAD(P)-dependent dehydrogenase (short-subunit alcohol dehydrogenase family)